MSTASTVPETYDLEGDDALDTLKATGWVRLGKDAFDRFRAADGFSHSRAVAFQFTLTALPELIALVAGTTVLDQDTFRKVLEKTLVGLAPGPASEILTKAFRQGAGAGGGSETGALLVGLAAALTSGTIAMGLVERGANRIYGVERDRTPLPKYGRAFLLACSAGLLTLVAFLLLVAGSAIGDAGRSVGGWSDTLVAAWSVARWPVGVVLIVGAFSLLLEKAPRAQAACDVMAGGRRGTGRGPVVAVHRSARPVPVRQQGVRPDLWTTGRNHRDPALGLPQLAGPVTGSGLGRAARGHSRRGAGTRRRQFTREGMNSLFGILEADIQGEA